MARILVLLMVSFGALPAKAAEVDWGGFIAVDLLRVTKQDGRLEDDVMGVGSLDIKLTARKDRTYFRLKLDLDDSSIGKAYKIFEEARLSYRLSPDLQVSMGKGVVRFHRLHWGGINASYFDNGSAIGGYHWTFSDQDNRLLASIEYGNRQTVQHTFTVYGDDTLHMRKNRDGTVAKDPVTNEPMVEATSKEFSLRDQRGGAYRLDVPLGGGWNASAATIAFWHRFNPELNYAFDAGVEYKDETWNLWAEALWGRSGSFLYQYKDRTEMLAQVGAEYLVLPVLGLIIDLETANFDYVSTSAPEPKQVTGTMSKLEIAARYELQPMTFWTNGLMLERQDLKGSAAIKATQVLSSISHWF